jgi:LytS/YehU family sensor histidine kinase
MVLSLVEEVTVSCASWINEWIVAVCAAGLVAGPGVGLAVSVFVRWLAVVHKSLPLDSIAIAMLGGGLAGGWLHRWQPRLAQQPLMGFGLTLAVSLLGTVLLLNHPGSSIGWRRIEELGIDPVLQSLGTALIWGSSGRSVTAMSKPGSRTAGEHESAGPCGRALVRDERYR